MPIFFLPNNLPTLIIYLKFLSIIFPLFLYPPNILSLNPIPFTVPE